MAIFPDFFSILAHSPLEIQKSEIHLTPKPREIQRVFTKDIPNTVSLFLTIFQKIVLPERGSILTTTNKM